MSRLARWMACGSFAAVTGCGRLAFDPLAGDSGSGSNTGTPLPGCATVSPWGPPVELTAYSTIQDDWEPTVTPDLQYLAFARDADLVLLAPRVGTGFGAAVEVSAIDTAGPQLSPAWSPSSDQLYFSSDPTTSDAFRLWRSDVIGGVIQPPQQVAELANENATGATFRFDALEMFYGTRGVGTAIHRAERATLTSPWVPTGIEDQLTIPTGESGWPTLSSDGLTMYFEGITTTTRIYVTTRAQTSDRFGTPTMVSDVGGDGFDVGDPDLSPDGLTLYFAGRYAPGTTGFDLFVTTRTCL